MIRCIMAGIKQNNLRCKAFCIAALVVYLVYLTYLTFFSHIYGRTILHRSINLIPFWTIIRYMMASDSVSTILTNIAGNIVAFMPMGFLLPMVSKKLTRFLRVLLIVLLASGNIEIMQYVVGAGVSDIDDIILNALGGLLGYCTYKAFMKILIILPGIKNVR